MFLQGIAVFAASLLAIAGAHRLGDQKVLDQTSTEINGAGLAEATTTIIDTEQAASAFLLTICSQQAAAEWFMKVVAPPSDLLTSAITPTGFAKESIFASSSRLLNFGWCSDMNVPVLIRDMKSAPWASVRTVVAQRLIQRELLRQATGVSDDVVSQVNGADLIIHTLMPSIRMALHSSPEAMAAARAYKQAWKDGADMLRSLSSSSSVSSGSFTLNGLEGNANRNVGASSYSRSSSSGSFAMKGVENNPGAIIAAQKLGGRERASSEGSLSPSQKAEGGFRFAKNFSLNNENDLHLSYLSSFLELDRTYSFGGGADAGSSVPASFLEEETAMVASLDGLEAVSSSNGEAAVTKVVDAFTGLLERPEFNFLRDLFVVDVASYCDLTDQEKVDGQQQQPPGAGGQQPVCTQRQQADVARLYGLHAFRTLHLALKSILAESPQERQKLVLEHERAENELRVLSPVQQQGNEDLPVATSSRRRSMKASKQRRMTMDTIDDKVKGGDFLDFAPSARNRNTVTEKKFLFEGVQGNDEVSPKLSVADPVFNDDQWSVDPRVFFAVRALLMRVYQPYDLINVGDPSYLWGGKEATADTMLKSPVNAPISGKDAAPFGGQEAGPGSEPNPPRSSADSDNPFIRAFTSLGLLKGSVPHRPIASGEPVEVQQDPGLQVTTAYLTMLSKLNHKLDSLLFSNYKATMPAPVAQTSKMIKAPRGVDLALAEMKSGISSRAAGFHCPSPMDFQALVDGKPSTINNNNGPGGPDSAFCDKLLQDVLLLSKVVMLAQMGADHHEATLRLARVDEEINARSSESSFHSSPETLRPPQMLLAAAQMVFGGKSYDKVFTAMAPGIRKYSENAAFLSPWENRDLTALADGVTYGSKKVKLLSYSTIDAVLMPPPLSPARRDPAAALPRDPALEAAETEMAAGRLCGVVLSATQKKPKASAVSNGHQLVFGRVEFSNHAQTVPEPYPTRRSYLFCTKAKANERTFQQEAATLATAFCAMAHNVGLGAQLQLEQWFQTQRYWNEGGSSAGGSNDNRLSVPRSSMMNKSPRKMAIGLPPRLASALPAFYDNKNEDLGGGAREPSFDRFGLDCNYLMQKAKLQQATNEQEVRGRDSPSPLAVLNPVPLDLVLSIDPVRAKGRKALIDRKFVSYASRFAQWQHRLQVSSMLNDNDHLFNPWPKVTDDINELQAQEGELTLEQRIFWSNHARMTEGRDVAMSLGPEVPLLLFVADQAFTPPVEQRRETVLSDDGKTSMQLSRAHSTTWSVTYVDHVNRIVIVGFAGLNERDSFECFDGSKVANDASKRIIMWGSLGGPRYKTGRKALLAVMNDMKGYTIILTGFSYGGGLSILFSKEFSLRAYTFSPAMVTNPTIGTKMVRTKVLFPFNLLGYVWKLGSGLAHGWHRVLSTEGDFDTRASGVYSETYIPIRGNGLITVVAPAGDWIPPNFFKSSLPADYGYELVVVPAFMKREVTETHNLANFAPLPINPTTDASRPALPPIRFDDFKAQRQAGLRAGQQAKVLDSRSVTKAHALAWLAQYKDALLKLAEYENREQPSTTFSRKLKAPEPGERVVEPFGDWLPLHGW